jgi:uncharacterized protein (UPF0335 family)
MEARKTINIVKQEKEKIETEVERNKIEIIECRRFLCSQKEEMEKLYEQQRRENVMLRETGRQYLENVNRVEEERNALKHQVEEWVKKNHTTGKSGFISKYHIEIIIMIITYTDLVNNKHTLTWNYLKNAKKTVYS